MKDIQVCINIGTNDKVKVFILLPSSSSPEVRIIDHFMSVVLKFPLCPHTQMPTTGILGASIRYCLIIWVKLVNSHSRHQRAPTTQSIQSH